MKDKKFKLIIIIFALIIIAAITNPTKEEFINYVNEQSRSSEGDFYGIFIPTSSSKIVYPAGVDPDYYVEHYVENITTSRNYVVFSSYKMINEEGNKVKVSGLFNNFIQVYNSKDFG